MRLSKGELNVLEQLANGNYILIEIANNLKKSTKQIYCIVNTLEEKGFVQLNKGLIEPKKIVYVSLLLQLLSSNPNLVPVISDSGLDILTNLLDWQSNSNLENSTKFKKSVIYRKLNEMNKRSILLKENQKFKINSKLWPKLTQFLIQIKQLELTINKLIPSNAIIYYNQDQELIFSCKQELKLTNELKKTAFSAYEKYGIKILSVTNYYYLNKNQLTKKDILKHSLYILEKEQSIRNLIFLALFYFKYRREFKIQHPILDNLKLVLNEKNIKGYPSYNEIKERAEVYNIKLK